MTFLWIELNCLKPAEPLFGDNLLLNNKLPGISSIHLVTSERWQNESISDPRSGFEPKSVTEDYCIDATETCKKNIANFF